MPFFYNTDLVPDNEFGALDSDTLLAELKKRAEEEAAAKAKEEAENNYYTRDPKTGLSPAQVEARQAQADAEQARKDAEAELKRAKAEQERLRIERETREREERERKEREERERREREERERREREERESRGFNTSLLPDTSYTPPAYTPPPPATPVVPPAPPPPPPPPPKTAPIDTVLFDFEDQPFEIMQDLLLEDIGGHELINIARNDTINGQTVTYQPIKNLTSIQQQYNPNNVVALQNTSDKYFANFSIKLETKLPEEGNGPDAAYVYIEDATGDLIIELINLDPDEQIEVQISLSGTIYEAEFNES